MKKVHTVSGFGLKNFAVSFAAAFLVTVIAAALLAALFALTPLPEKICTQISYCLSGFSAMLAAIFTAHGAKKNGLVIGIFSAFIYTLILCLAAIAIFPDTSWQIFLKKILISTLLGAVGGVIGVNMGARKA